MQPERGRQRYRHLESPAAERSVLQPLPPGKDNRVSRRKQHGAHRGTAHDKPGFPLRQTHRAPSNKVDRRPLPYKRMRPQRLPSGKDYPRWTKGNTPASGQKGRWRRSQVWWASAHLHPAALPAPLFFFAGRSFGVFREQTGRPARQMRQPG